jgi:NAD(P)-dependent dehydrogenase (short-subunit alcohol dehydrogenase family)
MKDEVCLITGATSGIGKATALALAKMGATVITNGKDEKRGEKAADEIKEASGNDNVELMIADLSSQSEVRLLANELKEKYPKLDVLINNAAVFYSYREYSPDGIEMQFAVNHLAHFLLTNLLL